MVLNREFVKDYNLGSEDFACSGECLEDCETQVFSKDWDDLPDMPEGFAETCAAGAGAGGALGTDGGMACGHLHDKVANTHPLVRKMLDKNLTRIM